MTYYPSLSSCTLCPRDCCADRAAGRRGACHADATVSLARAALHFWEEPPISGTRGSGTVFFSGCPLGCVYCQNARIASGEVGRPVSTERLAEIFLELQAEGAHNINLVTPTHYALQIREALDLAQSDLHVPVVWNTGGYETPETIALLDGYVDIFLTDFKYATSELAARYSNAPDYPLVASRALDAMYELVGEARFARDETVLEPGKREGSGSSGADESLKGVGTSSEPGGCVPQDDLDPLGEPVSPEPPKSPEGSEPPATAESPTGPEFPEGALMTRGIIVRHLLLPSHLDDSMVVIDLLADKPYAGDLWLSLMSQYTPMPGIAEKFAELANPVKKDDYLALVDYALSCGFEKSFMQEGDSVGESFIPDFDFEGL